MADKQAAELKDWRTDGAVLTAQRERDAAGVEVSRLEAEHKTLMAAVRSAEQAVEQAEARLQRGECTLSELSRAKAALSSARAAAAVVEHQAEDAYRRLADAEEQLRAASLKAQRAVWPGGAQQYKAAVRRLMAVLGDAMAAEAEVVRIHQEMTAMFPPSGDGWLVGPGGERLAYGGFGRTRRLVPVSHLAWKQWTQENILDVGEPAALRKRAAEAAQSLRAMVAG